ncbi:LapA family protein [Niveibacterium microcysteis]|nr:LapA family protein [Niveibacterium microcysteis]
MAVAVPGRRRKPPFAFLASRAVLRDNCAMRLLLWLLRGLVFFLLLGFALKNDGIVTLRFFFETEWRLPLIAVILLTFVVGVLLGVTAAVLTLRNQRREIRRLRENASGASASVSAISVRDTPPADYLRSL